MNFPRNLKFRNFAISFALIASGFVAAGASNAVGITPFTALYNKNLNGQVVMAGNTVMTCPTATDALGNKVSSSEMSNCEDARVRTLKTGLNLNNNAYRMIHTGAGYFGNKDMFNSSTANISIPEGSTIKSAFLFWHGDMSRPPVADGGLTYTANVSKGCESDATFCRDQVWLVTPQSTAANLVKADAMSSENPTSGIYRAHADITKSLVRVSDNKWSRANGVKSISIRVGDIESAQGRDTQAGWSVIVAYAHPDELLRNVVIYGGLAKVAKNDPAEIELSGFQTPPSGSVATSFGLVAAEGDASEGGDFLKLISGKDSVTIGDTANPINNPANSTISQNGSIQSYLDNSPGLYTNTFGTDADNFTLLDALPNNATSVKVQMGTNLETWYPIAFTMSTELYSPEIQLTKIIKDSPAVQDGVDVGDLVEFSLFIANVSNSGTAENVVIKDQLPAGLSFVSTPSGGVGCTGSGQTFICDLGDLPANYPPSGTCGCVEFTASVNAGTGKIPNVATASYSGPVGSLEATSNIVNLEYSKYTSDLFANIVAEDSELTLNEPSDITFGIRNEGPATDSNYSIVIDIPAEVEVVNLPAGCTLNGQEILCDATAGTSSNPATSNELGAGEYVSIPITVEPTVESESFTFTTEVFSGEVGNDGDVNNLNNVSTEQVMSSSEPTEQSLTPPAKNKAPTVLPIEIELDAGQTAEIDVTEFLRDSDFDEMEVVSFTNPTDGSGQVALNASVFFFTASEDFYGVTNFKFKVSDIREKEKQASVDFIVYPNELPDSGGGSIFQQVTAFFKSIFN
jgi:uncharacterized repeat protein (TIGR01451 family)